MLITTTWLSQPLVIAKKKNQDFRAFCESVAKRPICKGLSLTDFLIMPVQRIPRYVMLLESLLKATPVDHPDRTDLSEAFKKMSLVATYVNEKKRDVDALDRVLDIQEKLVGKYDKLGEPHRRYITEGNLKIITGKKEKEHYWFLFNDLMVQAKVSSRRFSGRFGSLSKKNSERKLKFTFVCQIELIPEMEIEEFNVRNASEFGFRLFSKEKEFIFGCGTVKEKDDWMNAIEKAIRHLKTIKERLTDMNSDNMIV